MMYAMQLRLSFFFLPVFGLNNGVIPVLAFNYGARNKARIGEALRFSVMLAFLIMAFGTLVLELIPDKLLALFSASDEMMEMGVTALRTIAWHFPIAGICIALGSVFQAFGRSFYSLIVSLGRQIFVLIPVAYVLSLTGKVDNVWWAFLISEIVSFCLTMYFFRRVDKKIIHRLDEGQEPVTVKAGSDG